MAVSKRPRLLIEDWLPAAAIGVECMREEGSLTAKPPTKYIHVWWARRPLCVSRAAVLGSLLPASFPRDAFERLLGFGRPGSELIEIRKLLDQKSPGTRLRFGFDCERAFKAAVPDHDLEEAHSAARGLWGKQITVVDPMAGGGSIPFEASRLGFKTIANEYNSVACSLLEVTVDYPFRFTPELADKTRRWAKVLEQRFTRRIQRFYHERPYVAARDYVLTRTVPCPDTGYATPLVPDWHLLKPKTESGRIVAEPVVNHGKGTWSVRIRELGRGAGQLREPPRPTYADGKGISLFSEKQIRADYIKACAQQGRMKSVLYTVVLRNAHGLPEFEPPDVSDIRALEAAEQELCRVRAEWEKRNVIPVEEFPAISSDDRPRQYGMPGFADMYSPRQLLCMGTLVEELGLLRDQIVAEEGCELGEAIIHLLSFILDKFGNYNCYLNRWENTRGTVKGKMDRHDFAFKPAFAELVPCGSGGGLDWASGNVVKAFRELASLPRSDSALPTEISIGSATSLPQISSGTVTAVVVDPPYDDNVQYSELADFFYVWLKRTQGHRRPEWFSTYLCEHGQEAVVNSARFKHEYKKTKDAKQAARTFYRSLMTDAFKECHRILRDDGVLTVMFTHKKQEAWETLFASLIQARFTITATWPVKTESEHSLHQAKKNAAQSTVVLVSRKRAAGAGIGYFDTAMREEIRRVARKSAERLKIEGLNAVDQLVGSFGPAMEVYSRYDEVRTDTGEPVGVVKAIDEASDAVSRWRIEQLAARGLEGVEPEGQFYLLCWDVLGAIEFRYNEAHLLGKAVGMDVDQLVTAGLVSKDGEKIKILPAKDRRRERALEPDEAVDTLFGPETIKRKRTKKQILKVHPNDPHFRTALDGCHALALRYTEARGGTSGIGSAKALMRQQGWGPDSAVAKLMEALVKAAPEAVRFEKSKKSAAAVFPEFRAWHDLLKPLFAIEPPEWKEKQVPQGMLAFPKDGAEDDQDEGLEGEETDEGEDDGVSEE